MKNQTWTCKKDKPYWNIFRDGKFVAETMVDDNGALAKEMCKTLNAAPMLLEALQDLESLAYRQGGKHSRSFDVALANASFAIASAMGEKEVV